IPLAQPVDLNRQELNLFPVVEFADTVGHERRELCDRSMKRRQALFLELISRSLRDHEAALPIITPVQHDENPTGVETAHAISWCRARPEKTKPENSHGCAKFFNRKAALRTNNRVPPTGPHDKVATHFERTPGGAHADPRHRAGFFD